MMRSFKYFLLALSAFFLLQQCTTQKVNNVPLKRQWMLIEFQDFGKDLLTKNKANIDLSGSKTGGDQYGAFMGCNRMFFTAKFAADGSVKFSGVGSTMMFCDKNMELESAFGKALPTLTNYKIDGQFLTLTNASGTVMKLVAADWD